MKGSAITAFVMAARFRAAQFLVVLCFVWPFINVNHFFPQWDVEVNFVPIFLAIMILPEVLLADGLSALLLAATIAVSALWGLPEAVLRILIGGIPCLFLLNLQQYCLSRNKELIPRFVAYRTLQLFVGFSLLQWFSLYVSPVIPASFTELLATVVPRYSGEPYDEFGIRGVQGWASEPAAGAMMCFAFAVVAAQQDPKKRFRILVLLSILLTVNKSVYAIALLTMLGVVYLLSLRRKWYTVISLGLLSLAVFIYASTSGRIDDFVKSAAIYGITPDTNFQLFRITQIIYPLIAFPKVYTPVYLYDRYLEPVGLLPLLVGYGSIAGLTFYLRMAFFKFKLRDVRSVPLAMTTLFVLSFLVPPDLIPAIVALAYALAPVGEFSEKVTWYEKLIKKAQQAYAT